jgi:hypothetical protein
MMFEPFHETDKAIAHFEKVIELEPDNVDAHFWLAKWIIWIWNKRKLFYKKHWH